MGFFLPLYDSIEYDEDDGISIIARGGGEMAPAVPPSFHPKVVGHPVLDVLSHVLLVGQVEVLVLSDFVVKRLAGGHHFWWQRQQQWWWQGGVMCCVM